MEDRPLEQPQTSTPLSLWRGFTIALWLLVAQIMVAFPAILIAFLVSDKEDMDQAITSSIGVVLILSFPLAVWLVLRNWRINRSDLHWSNRLWVPSLIALLLTMAVSFFFGEMITQLPNYEEMLDSYGNLFGQIKPIYLLLGGVLIGPICEELIFRGVILKEFLRHHPPATAIVFSALIFGVIHGIAIQVIYAFFLGLVLGWIYYRTRSLWLCFALHIINNALAFSGSEEAAESVGADMSALQYQGIMLAAALVIGGAAYAFNRLAPTGAEVSPPTPGPVLANSTEEE
ncbi:MAG: CPBP family intramembrane metalloprotease [Saprospiraceae bacterium]|nr:CPBP family intramembrane metalloprotease [Saprospiraceae bacterium]